MISLPKPDAAVSEAPPSPMIKLSRLAVLTATSSPNSVPSVASRSLIAMAKFPVTGISVPAKTTSVSYTHLTLPTNREV